jgi:hypothetical protein
MKRSRMLLLSVGATALVASAACREVAAPDPAYRETDATHRVLFDTNPDTTARSGILVGSGH